MTSETMTIVKVGFNQQQRQLLERLKAEGTFGATDGEIVRAVFVQWLTNEGSLAATGQTRAASRN